MEEPVFTMYRISGDVRNNLGSVRGNLMQILKFNDLSLEKPLSRPGMFFFYVDMRIHMFLNAQTNGPCMYSLFAFAYLYIYAYMHTHITYFTRTYAYTKITCTRNMGVPRYDGGRTNGKFRRR